jgi:hypothetical protein
MNLNKKQRNLLYLLRQSEVPEVELCFTKGAKTEVDFFCPNPQVFPPKVWEAVQELMWELAAPHIPADLPFCKGSVVLRLEPDPLALVSIETPGGFLSKADVFEHTTGLPSLP